MDNELTNTGKILIYQNEKGDTKIDVFFEDETICKRILNRTAAAAEMQQLLILEGYFKLREK